MKLQHATNVDFSACEIEVFKQLLLAIKSKPKCRITKKKIGLYNMGRTAFVQNLVYFLLFMSVQHYFKNGTFLSFCAKNSHFYQ